MTLKGTKLFTMNMFHDMIHHMDGMDQIVFYQMVLYIYFAVCRLHCRHVNFY